MAYEVFYKKSVGRDLKRLDRDDAGRVLEEIELVLAKNPESNPTLKGRFAGLRKFRVGDHRVIYALMEVKILILRVDRRQDVYKNEV
ncbi:MAG: type II toxin-antitoxin system RelE/ParE family toxin [Actinomycetota bacterium]|nr:type II toxin-antitoxin system RelE/ParE family toxin [Actinomycetota bacterium]